MRKLSTVWALCVLWTGPSFSRYRVTNGNIWFKAEETGTKIVAMAMSQYASSCVFPNAQYYMVLSFNYLYKEAPVFIHSLPRYSSFCDLSLCCKWLMMSLISNLHNTKLYLWNESRYYKTLTVTRSFFTLKGLSNRLNLDFISKAL